MCVCTHLKKEFVEAGQFSNSKPKDILLQISNHTATCSRLVCLDVSDGLLLSLKECSPLLHGLFMYSVGFFWLEYTYGKTLLNI